MPVTYRENSSAVKWNLFVYYHPSPLYHYLAGVFNPWQRGGRAEYRDERCSSSVRDGGSGCRIVPRLSIPPALPLDISTHISLFHARCDAICHLVSRFYNFLGERFREFRELPGNLERLETLQRYWIFTAVEYVFMKEPIVSWYPEERQREENDDVKWDKGLV